MVAIVSCVRTLVTTCKPIDASGKPWSPQAITPCLKAGASTPLRAVAVVCAFCRFELRWPHSSAGSRLMQPERRTL
jgi:hypothetical protein